MTSAEAKITKWFTTKARNKLQESKDKGKVEGGAVSEMITEIEEPTPSASVSKQTTNTMAESPCTKIKLVTEPHQPRNLKFPAQSFGKRNFRKSFQSS